MKRVEKERHLKNVTDVFRKYDKFVVANFGSMTAQDFTSLRKGLKAEGCGVSVVKNSIAHIALKEVGKEEGLKDKFKGAVFIAYSSDVIVLAKAVSAFMKTAASKVSVLCAYDGGQVLPPNRVVFLANLPSLDELRMRIMCLIAYGIPMRLAGCIKAMGEGKKDT